MSQYLYGVDVIEEPGGKRIRRMKIKAQQKIRYEICLFFEFFAGPWFSSFEYYMELLSIYRKPWKGTL